jgi:hypothetical protein
MTLVIRVKRRPPARKGNGYAGKRRGSQRWPCGNGLERGANVAPPRKGADFPRVPQDAHSWHTCTLGMVTRGSLVRPAASGIFPAKMQGPCEVLSSWSDDRALHRALVRLERGAVQVAGAVLRGRGGGDTALLPRAGNEA